MSGSRWSFALAIWRIQELSHTHTLVWMDCLALTWFIYIMECWCWSQSNIGPEKMSHGPFGALAHWPGPSGYMYIIVYAHVRFYITFLWWSFFFLKRVYIRIYANGYLCWRWRSRIVPAVEFFEMVKYWYRLGEKPVFVMLRTSSSMTMVIMWMLLGTDRVG